ncbi:biotin attachment protein [Alicyclobacillaceae bacterium I2511]|nr:biotin attachment protein [Alicyclobacillaceae bacterium I2511]
MADMKLPQLGESVTEGTLTAWLKQLGAVVQVDEPLLEVTTDKVNVEVLSEQAGVLTALYVQAGEKVRPGTLICHINPEKLANDE